MTRAGPLRLPSGFAVSLSYASRACVMMSGEDAESVAGQAGCATGALGRWAARHEGASNG